MSTLLVAATTITDDSSVVNPEQIVILNAYYDLNIHYDHCSTHLFYYAPKITQT